MISKSEIKSITQLQRKKYRDARNVFVAEGPKVIAELVAEGVKMEALFCTEPMEQYQTEGRLISLSELQKISSLTTANHALAVFHKPGTGSFKAEGLVVVLDAVRDPGNLGTIIRLCDWFGVSQLLCSKDTVDCFNPKVVQATMGSIARVAVHYTDLVPALQGVDLPIFGAFMDGDSVYQSQLPDQGILVMGNEANGISEDLSAVITSKISIPQFGNQRTESLNVATATAILLSEFRRTIEK